MILCASEPAAWSWDTTIAAVGAVATIIVAVWALVVTVRANRLDAERRERDDRTALSGAVDEYLAVWVPVGLPQPREAVAQSSQALHAAAASISPGAHEVARWVIRALDEADRANLGERAKPPTTQGFTEHPSREVFGFAARVQARSRVTMWIATGRLDEGPLFGLYGGES